MTKEKIASLIKYVSHLQDKLASSVVPPKHKNREQSYRTFLRHEIITAQATINAAKDAEMAAPQVGKK